LKCRLNELLPWKISYQHSDIIISQTPGLCLVVPSLGTRLIRSMIISAQNRSKLQ
jgi:hypothetical protein